MPARKIIRIVRCGIGPKKTVKAALVAEGIDQTKYSVLLNLCVPWVKSLSGGRRLSDNTPCPQRVGRFRSKSSRLEVFHPRTALMSALCILSVLGLEKTAIDEIWDTLEPLYPEVPKEMLGLVTKDS